ncbi:MAG: hypothetical protein ACHQFW_08120, partial [Chitinophagales bacterium]
NYSEYYTSVDGVNKEGGIYASAVGEEYGFQSGDKLISINGKKFDRLDDYISARLYSVRKWKLSGMANRFSLQLPTAHLKIRCEAIL